jgi:hypothetical protein
MKTSNITILASFLLVNTAPFPACAQGGFLNLDFEDANPISIVGSPIYPYAVTAASALPDWTVSYGGVPQTQITFNAPSTGATAVTLLGTAYGTIDGNYSVLLQGYGLGASISQTAVVPDSTQSLFFRAQASLGPLTVSIGSQDIPFAAVGTGPNYTLYGANIAAWAGQTEQLKFSASQDFSQPNNWTIDDIAFSPNAVPEPNTLALILMGGLALSARRRRTSGS